MTISCIYGGTENMAAGSMRKQEDLFTFRPTSMSSHKSSILQTRNTCSKPWAEEAISRISSAYNIMEAPVPT